MPTIEVLYVKPGVEEIANERVACWDQDQAHFAVDPAWKTAFGGAHIVGNPRRPNAIYRVARTAGVEDAVRKGRLVVLDTKIEDAVVLPSTPDMVEAPNVPAVGEVAGTGDSALSDQQSDTDLTAGSSGDEGGAAPKRGRK